MATSLMSMIWKIPKAPPKKLHYLNISRSYSLVARGQIRSHCERQPCWYWRNGCQSVRIPSVTQIRNIHVTQPNRALHPLIILLLRPISKFITIVTARIIRKWWRKLTPTEKEMIWNKIRKKQAAIVAAGSFAFFTFVLYYYEHVVETPLTKRKRFIMMNNEFMSKLSDFAATVELEAHKRDIVPPNHPFFQRAARVTNKIILANRDIPQVRDTPWTLVVVDRPDITNACTFATGTIMVFTGILNVCTNDDQLAIVLSHELSHAILSHNSENISKLYLIEALLIIPCFVCWIVFSDFWALVSDRVLEFLSRILIHLPFSRYIEREADTVGVYLAARACFDVRQAPAFWSKMSVIESQYPSVEWLSTHPTSKTRQEDIMKIMPSALELRAANNCPRLRNPSVFG